MVRAMLTVALVVAAFGLCGCGAAQQAAADRDFDAIAQATATDLKDKSVDPIRDKVPFMGNGGINAMSAPDSCPNEEEKRALIVLRSKTDEFRSKVVSLNDKYSFRDLPQMLKAMDAMSYGLVKLYRCEITYQQYAEAYERIRNNADQDFAAVKAQIDAENQARAQAAAAAFGAAAQGIGQAMQQQEAIRRANRPRQTSCKQIGNRIDCTTF